MLSIQGIKKLQNARGAERARQREPVREEKLNKISNKKKTHINFMPAEHCNNSALYIQTCMLSVYVCV